MWGRRVERAVSITEGDGGRYWVSKQSHSHDLIVPHNVFYTTCFQAESRILFSFFGGGGFNTRI
jgi:hypothetical protein